MFFSLLIWPLSRINSISFSETPAQLLGDGLLIKGCAADITLAFVTHQYKDAANHVAPL
jgi:hypothetical protein